MSGDYGPASVSCYSGRPLQVNQQIFYSTRSRLRLTVILCNQPSENVIDHRFGIAVGSGLDPLSERVINACSLATVINVGAPPHPAVGIVLILQASELTIHCHITSVIISRIGR